MAGILKHWREAATLMLVTSRHSSKGVHFQPISNSSNVNQNALRGDNFDILLLKRSSKSKFMPSLYVFPGGVASDADFSEDWKNIFHKTNFHLAQNTFKYIKKEVELPMFTRKRDVQFSSIPPQLAFRICAIRETFEESGILLARNIQDLKSVDNEFMMKYPVQGSHFQKDDVLEYWRKQVDADASKFIDMCKELNIVPDVWSLYEWSSWLTPIGAHPADGKRRFDTAFFIACVPEKPDGRHDDGETVHLQWGSPVEVLKEYSLNNAQIAPPQIYELSRLCNFSDINELHEFVWKRESQGLIRYFPVHMKCQDAYCSLLPGDDLYPKDPDFENGAPIEEREETYSELSSKYPNQHRTVLMDRYHVACNIDMYGGHVKPLVSDTVPNTVTGTQPFKSKL